MKKIKTNLIIIIGFVLPLVIIFRPYFSSTKSLVWGDAPYFSAEGFKDLASEPLTWTNRGNNFGGVNRFLWNTPLMFSYGVIAKIFAYNNEVLIRLFFYLPSLLMVPISIYLFVRNLGLGKKAGFFASLFYTFNTYYLLLVDGGVVGIALAYAFFPLVFLFLKKLFESPSYFNTLASFLGLLAICVFDLRIGITAVVFFLMYLAVYLIKFKQKLNIKALFLFGLILAATLVVNFYWLYQYFLLGSASIETPIASQSLVNLLDSLLVFQPHWPGNIFGQTNPPAYYYAFLPLVLFLSLFTKERKKALIFCAIFLIAVFLTKGGNPPLGNFYNFGVERIPFGFVFRDSSKFYIPLIFSASILVGITGEYFFRKKIYFVLMYFFVFLLIKDGFQNKLNFALAGRDHNSEFKEFSEDISREQGFFRALWFPEKYPIIFQTEEKPGLDAKNLVEERLFSYLNTGSYDKFNFINNRLHEDFFDLLGIKYLVFSGDFRKPRLEKKEQEEWQNLLDLVGKNESYERSKKFESLVVYENKDYNPRYFYLNKIFLVVGGLDIYDYLAEKTELNKIGLAFAEDGFDNLANLDNLPGAQVAIIFNNKNETDLQMSLLAPHFVGADKALSSEWARRTDSDYLRYKYELLVKNLEYSELDYGRGIAFSSEENEKISFRLKTKGTGKYYLAVRSLVSQDSRPLLVNINNGKMSSEEEVGVDDGLYHWFIKEIDTESENVDLTIENPGGLQVLNTIALISEAEWNESKVRTDEYLKKFKSYSKNGKFDFLSDLSYQNLSARKTGFRYQINLSQDKRAGWIVFSDRFNDGWRIKSGKYQAKPIALYSLINAFPLNNEASEVEIVFVDQYILRKGILVSAAGFLVIGIIFLWLYEKRDVKDN